VPPTGDDRERTAGPAVADHGVIQDEVAARVDERGASQIDHQRAPGVDPGQDAFHGRRGEQVERAGDTDDLDLAIGDVGDAKPGLLGIRD
jgi:hypothetical protein